MAVIAETTTANGDWSATGSWTLGVVPINGANIYTLTLNHNIVYDDSVTIPTVLGNGVANSTTPAITIATTKSLTVAKSTADPIAPTVSHILRLEGDLSVTGTLNIGTVAVPIPSTKTFTLQFDCSTGTASDGKYGLKINAGGAFVCQGVNPWGTSIANPDRCFLAADQGGYGYCPAGVDPVWTRLQGELMTVANGYDVGANIRIGGTNVVIKTATADGGTTIVLTKASAAIGAAGAGIGYCLDGRLTLTSDVTTAWKDNDKIALASTSRTYSECESGLLNGAASGTTLTVDTFGGTSGSPLYAHIGVATLLTEFNTPHQTAPFSDIKTDQYMPAYLSAMELGRTEIEAIATNNDAPSFDNTIVALEQAGKLLSRLNRIFFNINSAATNDSIQAIAREVSPLLSDYSNDISLNEGLFERVKQVYDNRNNLNLNPEQLMLLTNTYKGFTRQGALLSNDDKASYRLVTSELSKLSVAFGENLLAETNDYRLHITNPDDLAGLPDHVKEAAALTAKNEDKAGWIFSLQGPSFLGFMKYADNRTLREELFKAYTSRCNKNNARDNKANVIRQAQLRLEMSKLLGYNSYADYVLEERMAQSPDKVNAFLNELLDKSYPFAVKDVADVAAFAKSQGLQEPLQRWDFAYYSEKLKKSLFDISDEMVKPYFELGRVTEGIFSLTNKLYGLTYKKNPEIPVYHPDVTAYEVYDADGSFLSVLYLDFHPRSSKQGGAWMTSYKEQSITNDVDSRPHISVVCNFTAPTETNPSLLTYNEVTTFLHEFGHALHGMLSKVTYESLSGTSVYRDFVELPSQIMENWAQEKEWLQQVAVHYQTGASIPTELIDKIIESGNFQSGYGTVRQLSFGINDMAWHSLTDTIPTDVVAFEQASMAKTELFPSVEGACASSAFSHIFDGGYAAGYYGYKWAEVLDADAFSMFKKEGIYNTEIASRFREEILSKGGTAHPMELYINFRGQEPSIQPLLERSGLVK